MRVFKMRVAVALRGDIVSGVPLENDVAIITRLKSGKLREFRVAGYAATATNITAMSIYTFPRVEIADRRYVQNKRPV